MILRKTLFNISQFLNQNIIMYAMYHNLSFFMYRFIQYLTEYKFSKKKNSTATSVHVNLTFHALLKL